MHLYTDSTNPWNCIAGMKHYSSKIHSLSVCFDDGGREHFVTFQTKISNGCLTGLRSGDCENHFHKRQTIIKPFIMGENNHTE